MNRVEEFLRKTFISSPTNYSAGAYSASSAGMDDAMVAGNEDAIARRYSETAQQAIKCYLERLTRIELAVNQLLSAIEEGANGMKALVAVAGQSSMAAMATKPDEKKSTVSSAKHKRTASLLHLTSTTAISAASPSVEDHPTVIGHQQLHSFLKNLEEGLGRVKTKSIPAFKKDLSEQVRHPLANLQLRLEEVDNLQLKKADAIEEMKVLIDKGIQQMQHKQEAAADEGSMSHLLARSSLSPTPRTSLIVQQQESSRSLAYLCEQGGVRVDISSIAAALSPLDRKKFDVARSRLTQIEGQCTAALSSVRENELLTTANTSQSFLFAFSGLFGSLACRLQHVLGTTLPLGGQLLLPSLEASLSIAADSSLSQPLSSFSYSKGAMSAQDSKPMHTVMASSQLVPQSSMIAQRLIQEYNFSEVNNVSPKSLISGESSGALLPSKSLMGAPLFSSGGGGSVNTPTAETGSLVIPRSKFHPTTGKSSSTSNSVINASNPYNASSIQSTRLSGSALSHATTSDEFALPRRGSQGRQSPQNQPQASAAAVVTKTVASGIDSESGLTTVLHPTNWSGQQNAEVLGLPPVLQPTFGRVTWLPRLLTAAGSSTSLNTTVTTLPPVRQSPPSTSSVTPASSFRLATEAQQQTSAATTATMVIKPIWQVLPKLAPTIVADALLRPSQIPLNRSGFVRGPPKHYDPLTNAYSPSSLKDETPKGWDGSVETFGTMLRGGGGGYGYGASHGHYQDRNGVAVFSSFVPDESSRIERPVDDRLSINISGTATDYPTTTYGGSVLASVEHGTATTNSFISSARDLSGATPTSQW